MSICEWILEFCNNESIDIGLYNKWIQRMIIEILVIIGIIL